MSRYPRLFFDPGHADIPRAAHTLADALDMKVTTRPTLVAVSRDRFSDDFPVQLGGDIDTNIYSMEEWEGPEDEAVFDGCPLVWTIRTYPRLDEVFEREAAWEVMQALAADGPGWPMVLTWEFGRVDATYDAVRGLRRFPWGTRADGTGRAVWG